MLQNLEEDIQTSTVQESHENKQTSGEEDPQILRQIELEGSQRPQEVVQLRHGRIYCKGDSDPGKYDRSSNTPKSTKGKADTKASKESKKMANITLVNNVLYNNVPVLIGEDSPRKQNEINEFISCARLGYETLAEAQDKALFVKLLPTRLRGRALEVLQAGANDTLEDIFKTLKRNLTQDTPYITLNTQLRNVQQLPTETLMGYFNRVKSLIIACKNAAEQQYTNGGEGLRIEIEEVGLHCFKLGITNPNYKFYLLQDVENNLEALGNKIAKLEQTEKCMQQGTTNQQTINQSPATLGIYTPNQRTNRSYNQTIREQPTSGQHWQQTQYQSRNYNRYNGQHEMPRNYATNNKPQERQDKRQIRCHFCGKMGHVIAECRTKQMTPFCTICKAYGHATQNCGPQRQRNQMNSNTNHDQRRRQVNHTTATIQAEQCNFCLDSEHTEDRCYLKERWERLQLERQAGTNPSGNRKVATEHTASRH